MFNEIIKTLTAHPDPKDFAIVLTDELSDTDRYPWFFDLKEKPFNPGYRFIERLVKEGRCRSLLNEDVACLIIHGLLCGGVSNLSCHLSVSSPQKSAELSAIALGIYREMFSNVSDAN